jgi:hypothetical protein
MKEDGAYSWRNIHLFSIFGLLRIVSIKTENVESLSSSSMLKKKINKIK